VVGNAASTPALAPAVAPNPPEASYREDALPRTPEPAGLGTDPGRTA
jgi:hypothetical protein